MLDTAQIEKVKPGASDLSRLDKICHLDGLATDRFSDRLFVDTTLTRSLVSFQANKTRPVYRWYKYKEGFSAELVEYLFSMYGISSGKMLDPFAGSGTALFVASNLGLDADGIELLPIGREIIQTRKILEHDFTHEDYERLQRWLSAQTWKESKAKARIGELRITKGAYPAKTLESIGKYLVALRKENSRVQSVLRFALLCVLEAVSFTRKDGQYLRWDHRAGRRQGKKIFDKGEIAEFDRAVCEKITQIMSDVSSAQHALSLFPVKAGNRGEIVLHSGSCLDVLSRLPDGEYDAVVTSPPYCNRYDYTRTYALELALLGTDEKGLSALRQEMISCTVENRVKDLLGLNPAWKTALAIADQQELLQSILEYLDLQKAKGLLNNSSIPRMVKGYFREMACVVYECGRVLKPGMKMFMVNDNIRYAGVGVSADIILSDFAEKLGFFVRKIHVLPNGKGNSSQQMGEHGRTELRKCVYVWEKK